VESRRQSETPDYDDDGLTKGAIADIVVGVVAGGAVVCCCMSIFPRSAKSRKKFKQWETPNNMLNRRDLVGVPSLFSNSFRSPLL
jgi:hypothetical protein